MTEQTQQQSTWCAFVDTGLTAHDLWLHYFSIGGNLDALEVTAYLHGLHPLPRLDRNTIALALNELIDALPQRPRAEFDDGPLPNELPHL